MITCFSVRSMPAASCNSHFKLHGLKGPERSGCRRFAMAPLAPASLEWTKAKSQNRWRDDEGCEKKVWGNHRCSDAQMQASEGPVDAEFALRVLTGLSYIQEGRKTPYDEDRLPRPARLSLLIIHPVGIACISISRLLQDLSLRPASLH
jgi:hypothetical protein